MGEDIRFSLLIKMINIAFERELTRRVSFMGLTSAQCGILGYLNYHREQEVNPIDIEKAMKLKRPTITGILHRLERKGFIRLVESEKDKRYKQVVLTEKNEFHHVLMEDTLFQLEGTLFQDISEQEIDEVKRILKIMLKNMDG